MPVGTTTALIAGGLAAGGSIGAAAIGANAAGDAAQLQYLASQQAAERFEPFRAAGVESLGQLSDLTGPGGELITPWDKTFEGPTAETLKLDPGYEFRLAEGQKAIERSAAARGGLTSGGTAKALTRYAQDTASQEYQNAYNRSLVEYNQAYNEFQTGQENTYRRLMGLTAIGAGGAANQANALQMGGAAQAAGAVGAGNAWSSGVQGATGSIADLVLLSSIMKNQNSNVV